MVETLILALVFGFTGGLIADYVIDRIGIKTIRTKQRTIKFTEGKDNDFVTVINKDGKEELFVSLKKTINGINSFKYAVA